MKPKKIKYQMIDTEWDTPMGRFTTVRHAVDDLRQRFLDDAPYTSHRMPNSRDYVLFTKSTFGGPGFLLRRIR